jgi:hypothetical protein
MYCLSLKDCGNLLQTEGYSQYISPKYSNSPTTLHGVTTHPTTTCVKCNIEERSVPTRRGTGGGGAGTNYRGPTVRNGAQDPTVLHVFVFLGSSIICRPYKLTLSDHAQVTLQLRASLSELGYGYIGARTDITQQTNICLGIHCRNVWLHLNRQPFCPLQRHSNPMRTAASIWPDCRLETNSLCWRQTVGGRSPPTAHSNRFQLFHDSGR